MSVQDMAKADREQELVAACVDGDASACIELGQLKIDALPPIPFRVAILRFSLFIFAVTVLPIIIGVILVFATPFVTFGFFISGAGIVLLVVAVAIRGWVIHRSRLKGVLVVLAFSGGWLIIVFLCMFAVNILL